MQKYYAQFGEDLYLEKLYGTNTGTIVEVGAFDGVTYSNSYLLEKKGWKCVLVEPNPYLCQKISAARSALLFNNAAGRTAGTIALNFSPGKEEYAYTDCEDSAIAHSPLVTATETVEVEQIRLDEICRQSNIDTIDVLTIDVEGNEMGVLEGFSLDIWKPTIIIIEDNTQFRDRSIERYLTNRGYKPFKRSGVNDWYHRLDSTFTPTGFEHVLYSLKRMRASLRNKCPQPIVSMYRTFKQAIER